MNGTPKEYVDIARAMNLLPPNDGSYYLSLWKARKIVPFHRRALAFEKLVAAGNMCAVKLVPRFCEDVINGNVVIKQLKEMDNG